MKSVPSQLSGVFDRGARRLLVKKKKKLECVGEACGTKETRPVVLAEFQ